MTSTPPASPAPTVAPNAPPRLARQAGPAHGAPRRLDAALADPQISAADDPCRNVLGTVLSIDTVSNADIARTTIGLLYRLHGSDLWRSASAQPAVSYVIWSANV